MKIPAPALLLLAGLLWALPAADSALSLTYPSGKKVVVAKGGVKLYPRYNKSMKPITKSILANEDTCKNRAS